MTNDRVGLGWDLHRLTENRDLILCGVKFPYEKGLLGHSDADVVTHAVIDALLGACALPDIGELFPDTDPAYLGADSLTLLDHCVRLARDKGFAIASCDTVIVCQRPKLSPYKEQMAQNLCLHLGAPRDAVSVKAKTAEGLGPEGEGLAISAQAVVLVTKL